ncbi:hypothetical protein SMRU11_01180 (plasmid) [Sinorhizobium meliloti RU11/001]|nr:hypothetical protein SMRU11_01180 [Sinorhizobium meliloti RU11/001]
MPSIGGRVLRSQTVELRLEALWIRTAETLLESAGNALSLLQHLAAFRRVGSSARDRGFST